MNGKIEELAIQAVDDIDYEYKQEINMPTVIVNKFARLLIKECLRITEEQRVKILNNPDDPSWTEHLADVQTNIKNYFGIMQ